MVFEGKNGTICQESEFIISSEDSTISGIMGEKTIQVSKILKSPEEMMTDYSLEPGENDGEIKGQVFQKRIRISPEKLYPSPIEQDSELWFILNTRKKIYDTIEYIKNAISDFDDEIEREIQLGHVYRILFILSEIEDYDMDFESIISTLRTSFYMMISGKTECNIQVLVGFKILLERFAEKVQMRSPDYQEIFDIFTEKNLNIIGMGL